MPGSDTTRDLDRKLATIAAGRYTPDDFVIADAKDADMAFGRRAGPLPVTAPGAGPGRYRSRESTWTRCAPWSTRARWTSC